MTDRTQASTGIPSPRPAARGASEGTGQVIAPTAWLGWVWFAALVLILVGLFNVIDGLVTLFNEELFVTSPAGPLLIDLTAWGWVHVVFGALQVVTGGGILAGLRWALVIGVVLTMLNAVAQLLAMPHYPMWAIVVIALDVVVIWALVVHGREARMVADAGI